jgi:hypothetical protein
MESVFVHVTVVPTATFSASGMKARFPSEAAPTGIVTADDDPPPVGAGDGVGDGEGEDGEEVSPQAIANIKIADTTRSRNDNMRSSEHEVNETSAFLIRVTRWEARASAPVHSPNRRAASNIPGCVI